MTECNGVKWCRLLCCVLSLLVEADCLAGLYCGECQLMGMTSHACHSMTPPPRPLVILTNHSCPHLLPQPPPSPSPPPAADGDRDSPSSTNWTQLRVDSIFPSPHRGTLRQGCFFWVTAVCDIIYKLGWTEVVIAADQFLPTGLRTQLISCLSVLLIDSVTVTVDDVTSVMSSLPSILALLQPKDHVQALLMCASLDNGTWLFSVKENKEQEEENGRLSLTECGRWWWSCAEEEKGHEAQWPPTSPVDWNPQPRDHSRSAFFTNFYQRVTLTVAALNAPPFVINTTNGSVASYEGLCIDILDAIAYEVNFTYVITTPSDGLYGAPEDNGTWNGMVGMVKRGEADLAIGPITITSKRDSVVDFTVPYMEDGGGILSRRPNARPGLMQIFSPFSPAVWFSTGGMLLLFGVALFIVNRQASVDGDEGPRVSDREGENQSGNAVPCLTGRLAMCEPAWKLKWSVAQSVWIIFSSLMEQGAVRHPRRSSARVVLGCWWVFTILIMSIYTAHLAAMLTVLKSPDLIDSLEDLAASDFQPITVAGTSWETMFMNASTGVYGIIGQRMKEGPVVMSREEVMNYVIDGNGVFLYDISQVDYMYRENCKVLHVAKNVFSANGLGIVVPEKAAYTRAFNEMILKLQEAGIVQQWRKRWWQAGNGMCRSTEEGSSLGQGQQLSVESVAGIFIVYAVVLVLALLAFLLRSIQGRLFSARKRSS